MNLKCIAHKEYGYTIVDEIIEKRIEQPNYGDGLCL